METAAVKPGLDARAQVLRRARRSLIAFVAASAAAHAGMLAWLPGFTRGVESPPVVLEVKLEPPAPLPVAPPEPEPAPLPKPKAEPQRGPAPRREVRRPQPVEPPPVLALPAATPAAPAFTVPAPAPRPVEASPASGERARVAAVAVTPPAVGAAYLRNPPPAYPAAARRNGIQGTVMLRVEVARDGLPARVEVQKGSGSAHLDNAALEAVKAWRFTPARRGTEAVEGVVTFPIVFRLEG
jgi:protein TonB